MVLENINQIFSKMEWLDEEIEKYRKSEEKNKKSNTYYKNLIDIREKQRNGIIPFDEYKNVGVLESIEYGYYMANIHYELFKYNIENKDVLEDRIIFFLQNARDEIFESEDSWFRLNFYLDYSGYLREIYHSDENWQRLEDYVYEYKNEKEKLIYDILWKKYMKSEYINERINSIYFSKEINAYFIDAELIDADSFEDDQEFIRFCKKAILDRVNIMKRYSILNFSECKNHHIVDIYRLKGIVIYCGKYDYELQDVIYCNLEDICKCDAWEIKYGIRLITDY